MFFTIGERSHGLPVVAHCEWNEGPPLADGSSPGLRFWICASQEQVRAIAESAREDRETLVRLAEALPEHSDEALVELSGGMASSLAGMVSQAANAGMRLKGMTPPELMGFIEPLRPPYERGDGALIWSDADGSCHAVITRGKNQAATIIRGFAWMNGSRRERLLNQIAGWNARLDSKLPAIHIRGLAAMLLYQAATWNKLRDAQRRAMN